MSLGSRHRDWGHFRIRLPEEIKSFVVAEADRHGGSINAEIVRALLLHKQVVLGKRARAERRDRVLAERATFITESAAPTQERA